MNTELLQKIAEKAKRLPDTFDMWHYGKKVDKDRQHPCGSIGCIAGTAVLMEHPRMFTHLCLYGETRDGKNWHEAGMETLELSSEEANSLFEPNCWPMDFAMKLRNAESLNERGKVIHDRILHFIKTNGAD